MKRGISLLMAVIMVISATLPGSSAEAAANSKIRICNFIKLLVPAAGLKPADSQTSPYLKAAKIAGIVKEGDFKDYKAYITRTDAAVLLNRADELLHGDKVDTKQLETVLNKRISDIKKIPAGKREAVAKVYAKGFIVGKSNGMYIQNRSFKGQDYLLASDAKKIVALLKNTKGRAKMSPDGQLIRTTKLPKNAKSYPYILEAFPNAFYEMKFKYQLRTYSWKPVEGKDYASPILIRKRIIKEASDETSKYQYVDEWMKKVENNLKYRLNVDYRTIDNTWVKGLRNTYFIYGIAYADKRTTDDIKEYMTYVKKHKVVIKSSEISVEPSTLYNDLGYYVRVHVKFKMSYPGKELPQEKLIFARQSVTLKKLTRDKWFEGVYDINLATASSGNNGSDYAIFDDSLNDYFYKKK